jgi:hypothetical protein
VGEQNATPGGGWMCRRASLWRFGSPRWLLLAAFAGLNLLQAAFTNWCPMGMDIGWVGLAAVPNGQRSRRAYLADR